MAEIKWIKLSTNMFDDEKIKLIRTMPEGDSIVLIWVQLLCLAGKVNDGGHVYLGQNLFYNDEMLSTVFNMPVSTTRLALKTLDEFEMIELSENGLIDVKNWFKHQNIEGMEKIREQNRIRKQKQREREKQENQLPDKSHVTSRDSHATDKNRIDKNRLEEDKDITPSGSKKESISHNKIPWQEIKETWNAKGLGQIRTITAKRKEHIKARINETSLEDVFNAIDKYGDSIFIKQEYEKGKNWINFDWLFKNSDNFTKTLEGNYDKKNISKKNKQGNYYRPNYTDENKNLTELFQNKFMNELGINEDDL